MGARCKRCGAKIVWVTMAATGRLMPCDPDKVLFDAAGGPGRFVTDDGRVLAGRRPALNEAVGALAEPSFGRVPHWATCAGNQGKGGQGRPQAWKRGK